MKTDYIDLYFVHGINDIAELNSDTKRWAQRAKDEGKIRFFGFSTHRNMEKLLSDAAKMDWIDGIMMTYNFRIMHEKRMKEAVDACVKAGIGLTAMKTQGGGPVPVRAESKTELSMASRFLEKGFTDKQAKLLAVWENRHIASLCSQMPNLTILMSNVDAAVKQVSLSADEKRLLHKYACETTSAYCAGCASLCESVLPEPVPVGDLMRYLMYYHSYGDRDRARGLFSELSAETIRRLATTDFSAAERRCPQKLAIGKMMKDAAEVLG
jgi:predicted aldo/keto reductase-like oxidoreductase